MPPQGARDVVEKVEEFCWGRGPPSPPAPVRNSTKKLNDLRDRECGKNLRGASAEVRPPLLIEVRFLDGPFGGRSERVAIQTAERGTVCGDVSARRRRCEIVPRRGGSVERAKRWSSQRDEDPGAGRGPQRGGRLHDDYDRP